MFCFQPFGTVLRCCESAGIFKGTLFIPGSVWRILVKQSIFVQKENPRHCRLYRCRNHLFFEFSVCPEIRTGSPVFINVDQAMCPTSGASPCKRKRYKRICGHGGIGRLGGFRFLWLSRAGSSPVARTTMKERGFGLSLFMQIESCCPPDLPN